MDFELDDDQLALRDAARDLLARRSAPERVRAVVDAGGGYDAALWNDMVGQGWLGLELSPEAGGLGLGFVETAVLLEQVGAHVAPAPFLQQTLAVWALTTTPPGAEWGGPLLSGEKIATVAWREVSAVPSPALEGRSGPGVAVSGATEPALFAPAASVAIVRSAGGLHAVDLGGPGACGREPAMDRTREVGWLRFDAAPAVTLGGPQAAREFLDRGAVAHAAEMLGGAQRVLDMAVDYAKERKQFGRPIGSFQAVKHRLADMLVDVEAMRSAVYWAAWCIQAGDPEASVAASAAKAWCSDAARRVMASGLQVHGGIGFTWEHDIHLFLKRAQLDQSAFGDAVFHRARLTDLLRPRVEAGEPVL
ncbi:MAG: acyl-CoA/acyl-ACP dehydrogenase [Actinobacteria bacterium]|nr:acyl-CoA/acyl-ACP dehydrogenase [Actinomycetota bacterium]